MSFIFFVIAVWGRCVFFFFASFDVLGEEGLHIHRTG